MVSDKVYGQIPKESIGRVEDARGKAIQSAIPRFVEYLKSPDAATRKHAAEYLGSVHAKEALHPLIVCSIYDHEGPVRSAAEDALCKIFPSRSLYFAPIATIL